MCCRTYSLISTNVNINSYNDCNMVHLDHTWNVSFVHWNVPQYYIVVTDMTMEATGKPQNDQSDLKINSTNMSSPYYYMTSPDLNHFVIPIFQHSMFQNCFTCPVCLNSSISNISLRVTISSQNNRFQIAFMQVLTRLTSFWHHRHVHCTGYRLLHNDSCWVVSSLFGLKDDFFLCFIKLIIMLLLLFI